MRRAQAQNALTLEHATTYFQFFVGNRHVRLRIFGSDGVQVEEAESPLNFEDTLGSALNVLHRLMTAGGGRGAYHSNREFIRKIGRIEASLLNLAAPDSADPSAVQKLFEKHWKTLEDDAGNRACFSFDFETNPPYTELAELPWEFLSCQGLDLAVSNRPPGDFIRQIQTPAPLEAPTPVMRNEALQILLILSEPDADALRRSERPLISYRESYVYRLLRMYENMASGLGGRMRLRVLYQPRRAEMQHGQPQRRAVIFEEFLQWLQTNMVEPDGAPIRSRDSQDFRPQIVHFLGHLANDGSYEETVGCINDDNGLDFMQFQDFASCFAAAAPHLFILQIPEGVRLYRGPISRSGLLYELAQKRAPYILGFQHPLNEQGSLAFLNDFYHHLFQARSVPAAVTTARTRLNRDTGNFADLSAFGSPVLYTTLPKPSMWHSGLVSTLAGIQTDADEDTGSLAQMDLKQKTEWYGKNIRRLVEKDQLEGALAQLKEIAEIAQRSPDGDRMTAEQFQHFALNWTAQLIRNKEAFTKGHIDYQTHTREIQSITNRLLDECTAGKMLALVKTAPEKTAAGDKGPTITSDRQAAAALAPTKKQNDAPASI